MSIIPWVFDGDKPSVVESKEDSKKYPEAVQVINFQKDRFKKEIDPDNPDGKNTNVTYDLHVGEYFKVLGEKQRNPIGADGYVLKGGCTVTIQTLESVEFPINLFGLILPKAKLLHNGLTNTPTKVDPGYIGQLDITVTNLSTKPSEPLKIGAPFCTLCLMDILNRGIIARTSGPVKISTTTSIFKSLWWKENQQWIVTAIITILLSIMTALVTISVAK